MNSAQFESMNNGYAQKVLQETQATGTCLFLFDNRCHDEHAISFLFQLHTPREAIEAYSKLLYKYDSYLPHEAPEPAAPATSSVYVATRKKTSLFTREKASLQVGNTKQYWSSLGEYGYQQTAAMVQPITSHLYLIIGIHLESPRKSLRMEHACQTLKEWAEESLEAILDDAVSVYRHKIQATCPDNSFEARSHCLTNRERQVALELVKGKTNKEISETLSLSYYTVDNHIRKIYKKLDVHNRAQLTSVLCGETTELRSQG
ncbi:MAG: response regulator transcription factor [Gammaproteobacteria bacterium]|nr:response regulator transcription factor [Gammaproteobacteria bacterium]